MYDKINNSQAGVARKLFDYAISVGGRTVELSRVGVDTDIWGNDAPVALSDTKVSAIIVFPPGEMPLFRFREGGGMADSVGESALFFYDILPIEAYFQFKDRVEKGDIFYFTVADENKNPIPVILKVMDPAAAFSTQLLWRKFNCSPVATMNELPDAVQARVMEKIAV